MLDSAGRWILQQSDYRVVALFTLAIVVGFAYYRRHRYGEWPSVIECISVALNLLTLCSALTVGVVFLLTKPPAVDSISPEALAVAALVTVIAVFGHVAPKLKSLFRPEVEELPAATDSER